MTSRSDRSDAPSPQERLALNRLQIGRVHALALQGRHASAASPDADLDAEGAEGWRQVEQQEVCVDGLPGVWRIGSRALKAWWRAHPANLALDVAQPLLGQYASSHPVKLLAIAAGLGAAAVVARPWRLVSATGLLVAAVKSTQLGAVVSAFVHPDRVGNTPAKAEPKNRRHDPK